MLFKLALLKYVYIYIKIYNNNVTLYYILKYKYSHKYIKALCY